MSHFTVLVIGENPEEQLKPFNENLHVEYVDKTEEYRKEYETEKVSEFYCDSSFFWGMHITKELFDTLKASKVGSEIDYCVPKLEPLSYLKEGGKYRGYYTLDDGKRCKGDAWFEVDDVIETDHPNSNICFEGKVHIRKINPPKKMSLKDKYPKYEDYLKYWHSIENIEEQGYYHNPKAKWDWHQLGGRWVGFFKLKPGAIGKVGEFSLVSETRAKAGTADQARKCDIDFDGMKHDAFEKANKNYDEFELKYKNGELEPGEAYWEFDVENVGKDVDHYIPESREQHLKRRGAVRTFAVLKDGEWYEKGDMGWWGLVSNEKDVDTWMSEFDKLIEELPDDTLLSVYDCHI